MCGIAGILNLKDNRVDRTILEKMVGIQRHRGPDSEGFYYGENIGLGHKRLAIIDLSERAHQPMSNEDKSMWIIHTGEIYNYPELRKELVGLGHEFKSSSDTEVILHAFEEWREEALRRFNGMWAFAIWDSRKKMLFMARDRFGVKPFYYYYDGRSFIFASEIKALLIHSLIKKRPNNQSIYHYLISGYGYMDISNETFFEGIKQLKPSHYFKLSVEEGDLKEVLYWDLNPLEKTDFKSEEDISDRFLHLFEDSIKLRLRSDVPLGISLSGGLDSSSVACIASKFLGEASLEGFSSCFEEEEFDERKFIRPVLEKTKIKPNYIFTKPEALFEDLNNILWHQEEPYSTLSIFPQWYVMKLAHEKGIKVLLTGQAGDETLAGYSKYFLFYFADLIKSMRWKKAFKEISIYKKLNGTSKQRISPLLANILAAYIFPDSAKRFAGLIFDRKTPSYINRGFADNHKKQVFIFKRYKSILNNDLYNALKISPLPSLLHIDDRSSMAHSVESRAPFLDYRLVEFLFSVSPEYKIKDGFTKYILRRSLKNILPEEIRLRRDKLGFPTPLTKWFKTSLKKKVEEILNSREFSSRPYFDQKGVRRHFGEYLRGKEDSQYTIWSWINLELWLRRFID